MRRRRLGGGGGADLPGAVRGGIDGDFVVFLIGMRINRPWRVGRWWPVFMAMRPMLKELEDDPDSGLMHAQQRSSGAVPR